MTTPTDAAARTTRQPEPTQRSEGPAAAAVLAAGVGAFTLGLLTTLAEASASVNDALAFYDRVGPLSGKTIIAVGVWLVTWLLLQVTAARRLALTRTVLAVFGILLALGVLGTFPIFFDLFAAD
jgi:hypothetical protein